MLKFDRVPGASIPKLLVHGVTMAPMGRDGKPAEVVNVEFPLVVDVTNHTKALESLWTDLHNYVNLVAGHDDYAGEQRNTKVKLADVYVKIHSEGETVTQFAAYVKAPPKLNIGRGGKAAFHVVPKGKIPLKELAALARVVRADIAVTIEPAQLDLSDETMLAQADDPEPKKRKNGKNGKALAVVPVDSEDLFS